MQTKNVITCYSTGGAGTNQIKSLIRHPLKQRNGYADLEVVILDTSTSNLDSDIPEKLFYKVEGHFDGSGGVRATNVDAIKQSIKPMLLKHTPTDMNIVISSASGGSGSVTCAMIHDEIVKAGKPCISILIVDDSDQIKTTNTYKTLMSYDAMAKRSGIPMVVALVSNRHGRLSADREVQQVINLISLLFSNEHLELDNTDLTHFLNFTKVTTTPASIASLLVADTLEEGYNKTPVSLAMLHTSMEAQEKSRNHFTVGYSTEGFIRDVSKETTDKTIYYTIELDDIVSLMKTLGETVDSYHKQIEGVQYKTIDITKDKGYRADEDGLYL